MLHPFKGRIETMIVWYLRLFSAKNSDFFGKPFKLDPDPLQVNKNVLKSGKTHLLAGNPRS